MSEGIKPLNELDIKDLLHTFMSVHRYANNPSGLRLAAEWVTTQSGRCFAEHQDEAAKRLRDVASDLVREAKRVETQFEKRDGPFLDKVLAEIVRRVGEEQDEPNAVEP